MRAFLAAMLALAACGKSKQACKAEVDDLTVFIGALDRTRPANVSRNIVHLVPRDQAARSTRLGSMVMVAAQSTSVEGAPVEANQLANSLEKLHRELAAASAARHSPPDPPLDPSLLYLAIDRAAAWDRVVAVVNAARDAGFTHPSFLFALPDRASPTPRTWVEDQVDALYAKDGSDKLGEATGFARIGEHIVDTCPALAKVYAGSMNHTPSDAPAYIIDGTGPALIECNCDVDMPALRSLMWLNQGDPHPSGAVAVELAGGGKLIAMPAGATWKDAAAQVVDGATLAFAVQ